MAFELGWSDHELVHILGRVLAVTENLHWRCGYLSNLGYLWLLFCENIRR